MTVRHNLCQNPACSVSIAGWDDTSGGAGVPVRITGLPTGVGGFPVSTGAHYATSGTFLRTQLGAVSPLTQYTLSVYVRPNALPANGNIYVEWTDSVGGHTYSSTAYTAAAGAVVRLALTATSPGNAVTAAVIVDGIGNFTVNPMDVTGALIEAAAAADAYFDGDSPGATWDGTAGLSASTLPDGTVQADPGALSSSQSTSALAATVSTSARAASAASVLHGTTGP